MKKKILLLLLVSTLFSYAQTPIITLEEIDNYENKVVTLCEKVTGTKKTKGNSVFINFGKPYPNNEFTIVIFEKELINFSYNPVEFLKGKTICVNGKVVNYKGKMEIIVTKEEDIVIQ